MGRGHPRWRIAAGVLLAFGGAALWREQPRLIVARADPAMALNARSDVPSPVIDLLHDACFDCHSNDTRWPWYAWLPPGSWIVAPDVEGGRAQLNFSRWGEYNPYDRADLLDKACSLATKKKMPLWPYRLLHREARLSDQDIAALCAWTHTEGDRIVQGGE